jgi:hypothetical protein
VSMELLESMDEQVRSVPFLRFLHTRNVIWRCFCLLDDRDERGQQFGVGAGVRQDACTVLPEYYDEHRQVAKDSVLKNAWTFVRCNSKISVIIILGVKR